MPADAILIQQPAIDFSTFIGLSHQMLGYSPAANADASHRNLNEAERFLSCLAAMKNAHAPVGLSPRLLTHVSFSVLVASEERDMQDILECCAGMPFVIADTVSRGIQVAVVTGTLAQWRDAVLSGCQQDMEFNVRTLFNKVLGLFEAVNLNVWSDCARRQASDTVTFLLEDHR